MQGLHMLTEEKPTVTNETKLNHTVKIARDATERTKNHCVTGHERPGQKDHHPKEFLAHCRDHPDELFNYVTDTLNQTINLENDYREQVTTMESEKDDQKQVGIQLYRRVGFVKIGPYYQAPLEGTLFLGLDLSLFSAFHCNSHQCYTVCGRNCQHVACAREKSITVF